MALELLTTTAFEKDLRRVRKQGKDLDKLEAIVNLLQAQEPSPTRRRPHPLRGNWAGHWDFEDNLVDTRVNGYGISGVSRGNAGCEYE